MRRINKVSPFSKVIIWSMLNVFQLYICILSLYAFPILATFLFVVVHFLFAWRLVYWFDYYLDDKLAFFLSADDDDQSCALH